MIFPVWQHTFVSPSAFSRRAVVSYWRKYVHEVLVNCLGGLSLPRKSVVRLTDRPDMTLDVYGGRKTTKQSNKILTRSQGSWVRYLVWQHTFVSPSAFSRRAVVSYWRKYVHEVLVNRLGGLSLPRKSVVRLTDHPNMTLDVYRGRKTTMQQQQSNKMIVKLTKKKIKSFDASCSVPFENHCACHCLIA